MTIATMPARIASGNSGQAATTAARPGSVLQVSVGKWWVTVGADSRKSFGNMTLGITGLRSHKLPSQFASHDQDAAARSSSRSDAMRAERVDVGAIGRTQGSLVSAWLDLPVKRPVVLVLVVLIVAAPAWLLADWLKNFALHPTDFIYIEEAIDARALRKHLFVPLNTHVVPLFRLYTYAVVQSTDRLEHLPRMLLGASYLGLVATMLLVGRLVRQETGRTGPALGAMACMGITTVVLPVVSHYAASQALWSGAAIVATLLATHAWRSRGGTWRLVPAAIGVFAAPAIWSGGLVAGPAAAAALWADGRPRCRRAAVAMIALSGVAALVILGLSRQYINEDAVVNEIHRELWPRPIQGFLNAIQAVAEATILNNLGLDAATSTFQAAVILGIVAGLWYASRGRTGRATPLEAAGAATVVCSALLAYLFRGNLPFSSLRPVGWYYAIPQVGAVLFAAGWWSALCDGVSRAGGKLTVRGALGVVLLVLVLCGIQGDRAERLHIEAAPPLAPSESGMFWSAYMRNARATYLNAESSEHLRRTLARLDRAETRDRWRHCDARRASVRELEDQPIARIGTTFSCNPPVTCTSPAASTNTLISLRTPNSAW